MGRGEARLLGGQWWTVVALRAAPRSRALSPRLRRLGTWRGAVRTRLGVGPRATAARWPELWRARRERLHRAVARSRGVLPRARRAVAMALASAGAFLLLAGTFLARCVGPLGASTLAHVLTVLCGVLVLAGGALARAERLLRPALLTPVWWHGHGGASSSWDAGLRRTERAG